MNAENKFTGRACDYAVSRPSYASELIDLLYIEYGLSSTSVIADIGSGTGKFSKLLLDRQSTVFGVEPNSDMRNIAQKELWQYSNFHSVVGSAEDTTLPNNCVDCITVAQAFHWFDTAKFKSECLRIAKSNATVVLVWNTRDNEHIINREWQEISSLYCPDFKGFSNGIKENDEKITVFFDKGYSRVSFDNPLIFDREGFIKRSLSSSYSLRENDDGYPMYFSRLNELFDKYKNNGLIFIPNSTTAYIGKIN